MLVLQGGLAGSTTIDGSAGDDIVDYSELLASSGTTGAIVVDLAKHTVQKYENGRLVGTDKLIGIEGVVGSRYADTINGSSNADTIDGGNGHDALVYTELDYYSVYVNLVRGTVTIHRGDAVVAEDLVRNIEEFVGTFQADYLNGSSGADVLNGSLGDDDIHGNGGDDDLSGGEGQDLVYGEEGNDDLDGGNGNEFKAGGLTLDGNVVMDYVKVIGAPPVSMAVMLGAA